MSDTGEQQKPMGYNLKISDAERWLELARNGKIHTILIQEQQMIELCLAAIRHLNHRDAKPNRNAPLLPTRPMEKP
jgi:hypothetical protein